MAESLGESHPLKPVDPQLVDLWKSIMDALGTPLSLPNLERVATSVAASEGAWDSALKAGVRSLGLVATHIRRSPFELGFDGDEGRVIVTAISTDDGALAWVLFRGRTRRGLDIEVHWSDSISRRKMSPKELGTLLGVEGKRGVVGWLALESALALDPMRRARGDKAGVPELLIPMRRLLALLRLEKSALFGVVVFAMMNGVLALATPVAVQGLVGTVAFGMVLQPLIVLSILLLGALTFAGITHLLEVYVVELLQRRIFVRTSIDLAHRLPRVRHGVWSSIRGPELVNRFFDVLTVQKAASILLMSGLAMVLQTLIGLTLLGFYHPLLLAFALLLLLCLGFIVLLGRGATYTALKESSAKYAVAGWLEELARVPLAFKEPAGEALARGRADDLSRAYLDHRSAHFRVVMRQHIGGIVIQVLASVALLSLGGWLVIRGQLTLGQLVASELVVTTVVANYAKLGKYFGNFYDLLAGVEKIGQIVDLPLEESGGQGDLPGGAPEISIRGLSLPGLEVPLTLRVEAGERVAILGLEPRARRALFDHLYALESPPLGRISVGGRELRHILPRTLRDRVALVRGAELIDGTISENIVLGRSGVSSRGVELALEAVGLLEVVERLPQGLSTPLISGGFPLTLTEGVLLNFARALYNRPGLLMIDGALDLLSRRGQIAILERLKALPWPCTVLIAGESEALATGCGRVLRVEADGALREVRYV